jgi:hypothetical protein
LEVEDAVGWYVRNQFTAEAVKFKEFIATNPQNPATVAQELRSSALIAGSNLLAMDAVKEVLAACKENRQKYAEGMKITTTGTSWLPQTNAKRLLLYGGMLILAAILLALSTGKPVLRGIGLAVLGAVVLAAGYQILAKEWIVGWPEIKDITDLLPTNPTVWYLAVALPALLGGVFYFSGYKFPGLGFIAVALLISGVGITQSRFFAEPKPGGLSGSGLQKVLKRITIPPNGQTISFPEYQGWGYDLRGYSTTDPGRVRHVGATHIGNGRYQFPQGIVVLSSRDKASVEATIEFTPP